MKGDELDEQEEVKRVLKAILELGLVMPHSGFGATLNPDPLKRFDPPPNFKCVTISIIAKFTNKQTN